MRIFVLVLLVLTFVPACGDDGAPRVVLDWNASRAQMDRAFALSRAGSPEAARAALESAFRYAAAVHTTLREGGRIESRGYVIPDRVTVLSHLAEISLLLGGEDPDYIRRAIRLSYRAVKDAPNQSGPYGLFASALASTGCLGRAAENLEKHLALLPPGVRTMARDQLAGILVARSARVLAIGELGCEGEAREYLNRARELTSDGGGNPEVTAGLEELNRKFAEEANDAAERGDRLGRARVYARYGFLDLAKEVLDDVVRRSGVVGEVRWVVARYHYEGLNTKDSLTNAADVYEDLFRDRSKGEAAIAAWVRVQRRLGNIDPALERFGGRESPGEELRVELILTLFDRTLVRPESDYDGWKVDRREIDRLLAGEIAPLRRAGLLVELGFLCLRAQDQDRLGRLVANFRREWPEDRRVLVLEAGLMDLKMDPVLPEPEETGDGVTEEERGNGGSK